MNNNTPTFVVGDHVAFSAGFLQSTAQHTGPEAPCSYGPFARGQVEAIQSLGDKQLLSIRWADGELTKVIAANLAHVGPNTRFCAC